MPSPSETHTVPVLVVDRIACTGHGICASLLPEHVTLDGWGYPVMPASVVDPGWARSRSGSIPPVRWRGPRAGDCAAY
jgi:ferredoxin